MFIRIIRYHDFTGSSQNQYNEGVTKWSTYLTNELDLSGLAYSVFDVETSNNSIANLKSLKTAVEKALRLNEFPIVISDNHSSAIGTLNGVFEVIKKNLGVVWVDAHTDIHSPYTTHTGNLHGMPLAALLKKDHLEISKNKNTPEQTEFWESLKALQSHETQFNPEDVFYVGIRDFEPEEQEVLKQNQMSYLLASVCRSISPQIAMELLNQKFRSHENIFVSFDLDCLDPRFAMGVSVPAPGGLQFDWLCSVFAEMIQDTRLIGLELTEYNPTNDLNHTTSKTCEKLSQFIVNQLKIRAFLLKNYRSSSDYKIS